MSEEFISVADVFSQSPPVRAAIKGLDEELWNIEFSLKKLMDQGLEPEGMKKARALHGAAEAARSVMAKLDRNF